MRSRADGRRPVLHCEIPLMAILPATPIAIAPMRPSLEIRLWGTETERLLFGLLVIPQTYFWILKGYRRFRLTFLYRYFTDESKI
jgi:hypothetical protein